MGCRPSLNRGPEALRARWEAGLGGWRGWVGGGVGTGVRLYLGWRGGRGDVTRRRRGAREKRPAGRCTGCECCGLAACARGDRVVPASPETASASRDRVVPASPYGGLCEQRGGVSASRSINKARGESCQRGAMLVLQGVRDDCVR